MQVTAGETSIRGFVDAMQHITAFSGFDVYLAKMLELDMIVLNADRHFGNITVLQMPEGRSSALRMGWLTCGQPWTGVRLYTRTRILRRAEQAFAVQMQRHIDYFTGKESLEVLEKYKEKIEKGIIKDEPEGLCRNAGIPHTPCKNRNRFYP